MAGPLARIVAQLVVIGSQIATRAVVEAWRKAAANAAQGGGAARQAADQMRRTGEMNLEEARKILSVKPDMGLKEINKQYEYLFRQNDPSKGSSIYLQSKVYRAKEALDKEMGEKTYIPDIEPVSGDAAATGKSGDSAESDAPGGRSGS